MEKSQTHPLSCPTQHQIFISPVSKPKPLNCWYRHIEKKHWGWTITGGYWNNVPTVREIYKLDDMAYFGKFSKQVSWKKILFWALATPVFFFYQGFLSGTLTTWTAGEGRGHLFATLHVRWLSHIFNRITCIYQTATRWDLPPYRITILIDWWCDIKCLFVYVMILF